MSRQGQGKVRERSSRKIQGKGIEVQGRFLGTSLIDANCHSDICPVNIFQGTFVNNSNISRQGQIKVKARSRQVQGKVMARSW